MKKAGPEAADHTDHIRTPMALRVVALLERLDRRRFERQSRHEAGRHEWQAGEHAPGSIEHGRLMLSAGQAYMNARETEAAISCLEAAEEGVKNHKMSGARHGFSELARLYFVLGGAYRLDGRTDELEAVLAKERAVTDEIELHFGVHTEFLSDHTRLVYQARPQLEAAVALPE
jgi:hypothetical protein